MEIPRRCQEIRSKVEAELAGAADAHARCEVLVQGLYQLSALLLDMGSPSRGERYRAGQGAVLDLITYLALPLARGEEVSARLVTILVEVAESCADPVLQKKLAGYAEQLRARLVLEPPRPEKTGRILPIIASIFVAVAAAALILTMVHPRPTREPSVLMKRDEGTSRGGGAAPDAGSSHSPSPPPVRAAVVNPPEENPRGATPVQGEKGRGEQLSKIRVAANQVMVPVTLMNGGKLVKASLLLDTGATRTALRDTLAAKLGVELERAKPSLVTVADGRVLRSKVAQVDLLTVGPHSAAAMELEFYPYTGGEDGFDGLLGMDFLSRHRYQIDLENEVIRWYFDASR